MAPTRLQDTDDSTAGARGEGQKTVWWRESERKRRLGEYSDTEVGCSGNLTVCKAHLSFLRRSLICNVSLLLGLAYLSLPAGPALLAAGRSEILEHLLEYEVIWGHIEKTLLAGPSPTSPKKAEITISPISNSIVVVGYGC